MVRRCFLRLLLASLLPLATAAATTPEQAYREALAIAERGDIGKLLEVTTDALSRFGTLDADAVWGLRVLQANAFTSSGQPQTAVDLLTPDLPVRLRESAIEVRRLRELAAAMYRTRRGDPVPILERARKLARAKHPDLLSDITILSSYLTKDAAEQERLVFEALRLARRHHDSRSEASALGTLVLIRDRQERCDEAIDFGRQALAIAEPKQYLSTVERVKGNVGWAYGMLGDDVVAEEYFRDAADVARSIHANADLVPWLLQLGNVHAQRRDFAAADAFYREALPLAEKFRPDRVGAALANLSRVALQRNDAAAARAYNDRALTSKRQANDREGELSSLVVKARIDMLSGATAEAETLLQRVANETTSKSSRWEAHWWLANMYRGMQRNDLAEKEFETTMEETDAAREDVKEWELRLPFLNTVVDFYDSYIDFLISNGHVAEALQVADLARARTLAEGVGVPVKRVDARRAAREAGVVVLSYWLAPEKSYVWVVTPQAIEVWPLPGEARIASDVDAYQKEIAGAHGSPASARGTALYRMLVEPASKRIARGARVAIIPDARLHAFNFETLVVPAPQPHYWIEDAIVEVAPSLQFLARPRGANAGGSMLLVGNPPQVEPSYPALQYAAAEMQRVGHHFGEVRLLEGAKATPRQYAAAQPERFAYVHFVAHAIATRQRPLDSAVILGRDENGYKLYARDIILHPLHARLVTVSSCVGAGRRAYEGEGLVGLAWAFLRAGAHQVIAALWEVNDAATPQLMDVMYASIRAGNDPAVALRAAKLKLIHSGGVARKPLYWAPFVLYSGS